MTFATDFNLSYQVCNQFTNSITQRYSRHHFHRYRFHINSPLFLLLSLYLTLLRIPTWVRHATWTETTKRIPHISRDVAHRFMQPRPSRITCRILPVYLPPSHRRTAINSLLLSKSSNRTLFNCRQTLPKSANHPQQINSRTAVQSSKAQG